MNIDKKEVDIMKPRIIKLIFVPIKEIIFRAIRLCKPHLSIAIAIIKPAK
tara:strand:+ start:526 stop:675 length:150 start_codon:yes stop_codon:yes gene_type:complete